MTGRRRRRLFVHRRRVLADLVIDAVMNIEPLQRSAGLAAVDECAPEQAFGNRSGSASGKHDAGIVAAELQRQPLERRAARCHDFLPVSVEPVKVIFAMPGMSRQGGADLFSPVMTLTTPGGSTSFMISTRRIVAAA